MYNKKSGVRKALTSGKRVNAPKRKCTASWDEFKTLKIDSLIKYEIKYDS